MNKLGKDAGLCYFAVFCAKNRSQNSTNNCREFSYEETLVKVLERLPEKTSNAVLFSKIGGLKAALKEV